MKILMNAEAFGFGPSAMIAQVFREIHDKISQLPSPDSYQIDYVGSGHTLDLQRTLPYHAIYDVSEEWLFKALVGQYDCFITALDFEKARWARDMQVEVIIYDNLTWYWRKFPQIIHDCHYIAHQFYGVANRIEKEGLKNYHLVSPFCASSLFKQDYNNHNNTHYPNGGQIQNKKIILVNFGGLENPLWTSDVTICYVQTLLSIIIPLFETHYQPLGYELKILASKTHRDALLSLQSSPVKFNFSHDCYFDFTQYCIETLSRQEVETLLPHVAFALMTPGLGNIIDSAVYGMPVCFLPPANDSQGWQLDILREKGLVSVSGQADWDCFFDKIDYTQPQKMVLEQIKEYITALSHSSMVIHLQTIFQNRMQTLSSQANQSQFNSYSYSNGDGNDNDSHDNKAFISSLTQLITDLSQEIKIGEIKVNMNLNASDIMFSILSVIEEKMKKDLPVHRYHEKTGEYDNVHVLSRKKKSRKQKRKNMARDELSVIPIPILIDSAA